MKKLISISIYLVVFTFMSACSLDASFGYQPPILPVKISISTNGEIKVEWENSIQTAIGTFSVKLYSELGDLYKDKNGVLIVNLDGNYSVYELNRDVDLTITLESAYYKQIELRKEELNWYFSVSRITNEAVVTPRQNQTVIISPIMNPYPKIHNFTTCTRPCNGSNTTRVFPEKATIVYVEWDYKNIPFGSDYERTWIMDGEEWVKYKCKWPGDENGHDKITLTEPGGLHSGTWEMSISINKEVIIREKIIISGNWNYWDPVGTLYQCYGKVDQ